MILNRLKFKSKDATYVGLLEEVASLMEADDSCPDLSDVSGTELEMVYQAGKWWRKHTEVLKDLRRQILDGKVPYLAGWLPYDIGVADNRYVDTGFKVITFKHLDPERLVREYAKSSGSRIVPSRLPPTVKVSLDSWHAKLLSDILKYMTAGTNLIWERQPDGEYALETNQDIRDLRVSDRHVYRMVAPTSKKVVLLSSSEKLESWGIFDPHTVELNPYALLQENCKIERVSPESPEAYTIRRDMGGHEAGLMENFVLVGELLGKTNQHVLGLVSSNHFRGGDVKVLDVALIRSQATPVSDYYGMERSRYRGQAILAGDWEATTEVAALLNHFLRPRGYLYGHENDVDWISKPAYVLWPYKFPMELVVTHDEVSIPVVQSSAMVEMYENIMRQATSSTTQFRVPITAEIELADRWKNLADWKNQADFLTGAQLPQNHPQREREELDAISVALRLLKRSEKL